MFFKLEKAGDYVWWRIVSYLVWGALLLAMIGSFYFMYNYIYFTLDSANTIVLLSSQTAIDTLNVEQYAKAQRLITLKNAEVPIQLPLRNLFRYNAPANSSTTSAVYARPPKK